MRKVKRDKIENKDEYDEFGTALRQAYKNSPPSDKDVKMYESIEVSEVTFSNRHKIRMNRIFREKVGGSFIPFPEVDTLFERVRSKLVVFFESLKEKCGDEG